MQHSGLRASASSHCALWETKAHRELLKGEQPELSKTLVISIPALVTWGIGVAGGMPDTLTLGCVAPVMAWPSNGHTLLNKLPETIAP